MSQENVEVVRQAFKAFNAGDIDAVAQLLSPQARVVPLRAALEDVAYVGPNAAQEFWDDAMNAWSQLSVDIENFQDLGDRVLAVGWLRGTARDTGAEVETPVAWVATFEIGRIAEFRTYSSQEAALEAVGLRE